jgi:hypothetical protein
MSDRIHELLNRNLQEVFGEGDAARRRAAIESSTPMTAYSICLPASSSGTMHWTSSQETCVRPTLTSSTRLTASRRRSITPGVWRGGPVRGGRSPITPAWT